MLHASHRTAVPSIDADSSAGWRTLAESPLDLHLCGQHYDDARVIILSSGMGGGDILDESNGAAIVELAAAWNGDYSYRADVHHGMAGYTALCVDPDAMSGDDDLDTLADMLHTAAAFSEYPVLDESDYSAREWAAWSEALADGLTLASKERERNGRPALTDAERLAVAEHVTEYRYGWAEPGWVDAEWITEALTALGV